MSADLITKENALTRQRISISDCLCDKYLFQIEYNLCPTFNGVPQGPPRHTLRLHYNSVNPIREFYKELSNNNILSHNINFPVKNSYDLYLESISRVWTFRTRYHTPIY